MDLVECYDDPDRNGVFKISTTIENQVFKIMQSTPVGTSKTQTYTFDFTFTPAG